MEEGPRNKQGLLAGATGLVGSHLLTRLLAHPSYTRVEVLVRRELPIHHPKLAPRLVDFDHLHAGSGNAADDVFCCLGTTIANAGSRGAFQRVDHDYPLALANLASASGAQQFLMVSSLGADARSSVFYSRVKGETERDIAAIGLPKSIFMRPSILRGERQEVRAGEKVGILVGCLLAPLFIGSLRKYRPIHADRVAAAMVFAANHDFRSGPVESDAIEKLAQLEDSRHEKGQLTPALLLPTACVRVRQQRVPAAAVREWRRKRDRPRLPLRQT